MKQNLLFHFSRSAGTIKIFFKKMSRDQFCSMRNFLELQCLVDDFVDFLELSMFINASLP